MHKRVSVAVVFVLSSISVLAQNFKELFSAFRQQTIEEYQTFRTQCNKEYASFVEKTWTQFKQQTPKILPLKDKPVPPQPYDKDDDDAKDKHIQYSDIIPVTPPVPQPTPIEPIIEQLQAEEEQFAFLFFGTEGKVRLSDRHRFKLSGVSEKSVADAWRALSDDKYNNVIRDCLKLRIKHGLCDWAYLQLLADTGVITIPAWNAPEFLEVNEETGKKDFLYEIQRKIVLNSLIEGTAYSCRDFSQRAELEQVLSVANMHGEYLQITCGNATRYAVQGCDIDDNNSDISTGNGNVHQVHKVINASKESVADMFQNMIRKKQYGYYTYAVLMEACGLCAELDKIEDKVYFQKRMKGELEDLPQHPTFKGSGGPSPRTPGILPERKFFGYTLFIESDEWWEKTLGITDSTIHNINPEELVAMVAAKVVENKWALSSASTGTDYTDPNNALNQFVTYHIIPAKIEPNKLVIHFNELWYNLSDKVKKASVYDFYTTMGKRRLLKTYEAAKTIDGKRNTIYLNRFPILNNGRTGDYTEIGCDDDKQGVEVNTKDVQELDNAYIYGISDVLCFSDRTADNLGNERMRMDVTTLFPELLTNDIRCNENFSYQHQCVGIPQTDNYNYLENCEISSGTNFYYLSGRVSNTACWANYQGDELNIVGNYEVTMKLPPVPKDGVYELRMGISANDRRGLCQVYWGSNKNALVPAGMPIDMRMGGKEWYLRGQSSISSTIGYEDEIKDDEEVNAENDKKMRNNWYMKAPNSYYMYGESTSMRNRHQALRRIILREEMKADGTYYIHFRNLLDDPETEFYMDYIELCPKSVFDNPYAPEDIW